MSIYIIHKKNFKIISNYKVLGNLWRGKILLFKPAHELYIIKRWQYLNNTKYMVNSAKGACYQIFGALGH